MLTLHAPIPYALSDPLEQGGLLLGTRDGERAHVHACTGPLPGDDRGTHHLTLADPGHTLAAEDAFARGWVYLGYWHSHPTGTPPGPSEVDLTDFREALRVTGAPYLDFPILTGGVLRAWRLHASGPLTEVPHGPE